MRRTLAVVLVALVAALAAVVLGEYSLTWKVGLTAGVGVGLVLSELMLVVGRSRGRVVIPLVGACAAAAMLWAGRIDSIHGLRPFPVGACLGAVAAVGLVSWRLAPSRPGEPSNRRR